MGLNNKIIVTSTEDFDSSLKDALNKTNNVVFVSFISTMDKTTCSLWCRDCQISEPIVNEAFEKTPAEITLVECQIEREGYKGNPNHPYRVHPSIGLKAIPTLMVFNKDGSRREKTLIEEELANNDVVDNYIKENL